MNTHHAALAEADGPIRQKIRTAFCPYLVTARYLNRWSPYRVYTAYSYLGELFVLLAGFGLANPVMAFLSGGQGGVPQDESMDSPSVLSFLSSDNLGLLSVVLLLAWGLVKFYVQREDLEKRCSLISSYRRQCLQIESAMHAALRDEDPMPSLLALQPKLSDLVERNIAEGSIPELGIGLGRKNSLMEEIESGYQELVRMYAAHWRPTPAGERVPVGG